MLKKLIIAIITIISIFFYQIDYDKYFVIEKINIENELKYAKKENIYETLKPYLKKSFFKCNFIIF